MSRPARHRRTLLALATAVAAIVAGLLAAGLQTIQSRTFSLRVPNVQPVASVGPGRPRACEGPVTSPQSVRGVTLFGTPVSGDPTLHVQLRGRSGRPITGTLSHPGATGTVQVALPAAVARDRPVRACVTATGGVFSLSGSPGPIAGLTSHGVAPGTTFSLSLTRPSTLLDALPLAFSRAAIFRPSWVGTWTFWVLLGLLAATFGLVAVAIIRAAEADDADESSGAAAGSS